MSAAGDEGEHLEAAVAAALDVLLEHGIGRDRVVLAITDPLDPSGGAWYETHVGATADSNIATLLVLVCKDTLAEANHQAVALVAEGACPECGSQRYGPRQGRRDTREGERPGIYVRCWDECMSCGHTSADR